MTRKWLLLPLALLLAAGFSTADLAAGDGATASAGGPVGVYWDQRPLAAPVAVYWDQRPPAGSVGVYWDQRGTNGL